MRDIGANLLAHFQGEVSTLALLWKLTRVDGTVMGFTDHSRNVVYNGLTYEAATGFTATSLSEKADFSVDNLEIAGFLNSARITEEDLMAGIYDYAELEIMMVNYESVVDEHIYLKRGWLGEMTIVDGQFTLELRSLAQKLDNTIGEVYSPSCRAILGDDRCKVNLAPYTHSSTVTSVTNNQVFTVSAWSGFVAGYFTNGEVEFTSGGNDGLKMEVKEFANGEITLALPLPYSIDVGDALTAITGCDKASDTCKTKFNNFVNFRGEPFIPGLDKAFQTSGTIPDNPQS